MAAEHNRLGILHEILALGIRADQEDSDFFLYAAPSPLCCLLRTRRHDLLTTFDPRLSISGDWRGHDFNAISAPTLGSVQSVVRERPQFSKGRIASRAFETRKAEARGDSDGAPAEGEGRR